MSLLLDEKGPKNQGRHQGPTAHGGRPSPMSARARAPYPVSFWQTLFTSTQLHPNAVMAGGW
jgi:hypothetical protein